MHGLRILQCVSFESPPKNKVAILYYDDYWIRRLILQDIPATTLEIYPRKIYISWNILYLILLELIKLNFKEYALNKIYSLYIKSCLDSIGAKVVLCTIDNSSFFQKLSRFDWGRQYIGIQNGVRTKACLKDSLVINKNNDWQKISMPNLYCFGNRDIDLYKKYNHLIDNHVAVGSLIGGYFTSKIYDESLNKNYDICLVSQWVESIFDEALLLNVDAKNNFNTNVINRVSSSLIKLNKYLLRLINEETLKVCITLRTNNENELVFFKNCFGNNVKYINSDIKNFSSYRSCNESKLALGLNSTVLLEVLRTNTKVLFCNLYGYDYYEMADAGISYFEGDDYYEFKKRVLYLLKMNNDLYFSESKGKFEYISNINNENPPHLIIRGHVISLTQI